ncbi:MAG: hypothetical protein EXQ89_03710 [Rhodospirillaceae bacterium]|nr:hypothetical protein [Rhodospirillaceae bacterium]
MIVLGINPATHDAAAALFDDYRLLAAVSLERLTRRKGDGKGIPMECIGEVLAIAGLSPGDVDVVVSTRGTVPRRYLPHSRRQTPEEPGDEHSASLAEEMRKAGVLNADGFFDAAMFLAEHGFRSGVPVRFANHHRAHALPALFFTQWPDALLYTADGGGDNVHYSHRVFREGAIDTLFGDDRCLLPERRVDSLGLAYAYATQALGYRALRHEGKLTGLAAFGEPTLIAAMAPHFRIDDEGRIDSDFASYGAMRRLIFALAEGQKPQDVAASIQKLLEDLILGSVTRLLERHPVRHLGLGGGVFANVRLNRLLAERTPVDEIFVFPAMSDDGLAVGAVLEFLLERDGLAVWLDRRHHLDHLYFGRDHGAAIDRTLTAAPGIRRLSDRPVPAAADLLAKGRIVAIYNGGMEFGPRALGARSILAAAGNRGVNQTLNARLERTEFMPFAPVVRDVDAARVFDLSAVNGYASRFMTITCLVRPEWRERIQAVVHVDGTARPQVAERKTNPLYYDILTDYEARTGLPVLVNTSFNVHEEPIVNKPEECCRALADGRIDFVVTAVGVYGPGEPQK